MRLVTSSDPSEVDRFEAIDLLVQRAVLTRLVCRELVERRDGKFSRWRTDIALRFLMQWISSLPGPEKFLHPWSRLDTMLAPNDCLHLVDEIRDGARVCDALTLLQCADTDSDAESDLVNLEKALNDYWEKHSIAAFPPPLRPL